MCELLKKYGIYSAFLFFIIGTLPANAQNSWPDLVGSHTPTDSLSSGKPKVATVLETSKVSASVLDKLGDYEIGPEDILEIKVWSHDDLGRQVQVSQNGDISFPMVGQVKAAGKSPVGLETELTKKLADGFLVNPQISVKVVEYKSQRVYVVGFVNKPGVVPLTGPTQVVEAISMAGGVKDDGGNEVLVVRPKNPSRKDAPLSLEEAKPGEVLPVNMNAIQAGDVSTNLVLKNGDTIIVPKAKYFYVFGEVQKPSQYKYEKPITVLQSITIAGGTTAKASTGSIKITREIEGKAKELSVEMSDPVLPNDIVTVPESFF